MQQNARQLPSRSTDAGTIDLETGYDHNGNAAQVLDRQRESQGQYQYNRWMSYDGLDRLTAAGSCIFGGDCWHRFTYDAINNLRSWSLAGVKNHHYVYDAKNHLTNIRDGSAGPSVIGLGYDDQGNLGNKNGQEFRFDYGNRLRRVVGKEAYAYDARGRRLDQFDRPDTTFVNSFYNLDGQLLFRYEGHANEATNDNYPEINRPHVYLGGSLLATVDWNRATQTAQTKYYHTDALGSPVAVTNEAGQVVERTDWEPYGAAIGKPAYDGVGYTGHVMDGRSGLTYMQQRYHDPGIGRMLSVDPVTAYSSADMRHFNVYAYAFNNPYGFADPDGRAPCDGPSTCAIDNDIEAMNRGDMSRGEFMRRSEARAAGAATGVAVVVGGRAVFQGGRWLLTTKTGKETLLTVLGVISRNDDALHKVGKRVQRETVQQMKEARKNTLNEARQKVETKPPKPSGPSKSPEPPKPSEPQ